MSREQILANIEKIKAIELDDLIFLERDLDFDEKVNSAEIDLVLRFAPINQI